MLKYAAVDPRHANTAPVSMTEPADICHSLGEAAAIWAEDYSDIASDSTPAVIMVRTIADEPVATLATYTARVIRYYLATI